MNFYLTKERFRRGIKLLEESFMNSGSTHPNMSLYEFIVKYVNDFFPEVSKRVDSSKCTFNEYIDRLYDTIDKMRSEVAEFIMNNYDVMPDDIVITEEVGWKVYVDILGDIKLKKGGKYTNGVFIFDTIEGNFDVSEEIIYFDDVLAPRPNKVIGEIIS